MAPGPPPPEYGPRKPPRAREDTGIGRVRTPTPTASPAIDPSESIQSALATLIDLNNDMIGRLSARTDDSDVRHETNQTLRREFLQWRDEQRQKQKAREDAEAARARWNKRWTKIGTILGAIAAVLVAAWQTYKAVVPEPPPPDVQAVEKVKATVEDRTTKLETESKTTNVRLGTVEQKVDRLGDHEVDFELRYYEGIEHIGKKLDAVSPKARTIPFPESLTKAKSEASRWKADPDAFFGIETPPPPDE